MQKIITYSLSFLLLSFLAGGLALAQTEAETITAADLGVADPGILPTNPFYFLKEWGRGARLFFTFNPVSKVELELRVANEKAAELKRVQENQPDNEQALNRALENYQEGQERLGERLEDLRETSQNPRVDNLLDRLTDRTIQHEKLFDELEQKISHDSAKPIIQNIRGKIGDSVAAAAEKDGTAKFVSRIEKSLIESPGSEVKHLRSVEIIDKLERKAPEDLRRLLEALREEFSDRLNNDLKEYLDKFGAEAAESAVAGLPGDPARRSVLLEEIRIRAEKRVAEVLKKASELLDNASQDEKLITQKAREQIQIAKERVGQLENVLAAGLAEAVVKNLLESARENLQDAESALAKNQYGEAFGLARSAEVLARNGLRMLEKTVSGDAENLRAQINRLAERIKKYEELLKSRGFTLENNPKVFSLLENARQHLGFAKDALAKNDFSGTKLHIVHVTGFLKDLSQIIEGEVKVETELKVLRSVEVSDRCASIQKDMVRLKESFLAKEISEADYRLKIGVLQKEYERCLVPPTAVPVPVVTPPAVKPRPVESICTLEYAPVCGVNGKTYSNSCFAKADGVAAQYSGECKIESNTCGPMPSLAAPPAGCKYDGPRCVESEWQYKLVCPETTAPSASVAPAELAVEEFKIEADDRGFYPDAILFVKKGVKVKINFIVRTENVYYGGLDFRSVKFKTESVKPGGSTAVEFVADESLEFSSYWPASGVLKATGKIVVQ